MKTINNLNFYDQSSLGDLNMSWDNLEEVVNPTRSVSGATDALICSLNDKGCVDLEYMSEISNISMSTLIQDLKGVIFQDPKDWNECWYKGYKTKEEYLSGDIFAKIKEAEEANLAYDDRFLENVEKLKDILPNGISHKEIYYSIGSSWIDPEIIKDFIVDVFGSSIPRNCISYVKDLNLWTISEAVYLYNSANYTFGTSRIGSKKLLLNILNHKDVAIYDTIVKNGKDVRIFNKAETLLAQEKVELLERAFKTFIANNKLESRIEQCYNEKFRYVVSRRYDGSFLNLPFLYDHQKNAVARILFNKNTLLAHNVGAGKTYIMISAGEELLRLGFSTKNLYVVPNNIIGQWDALYRKLYPNAKLLTVYPEDFTIHTKEDVLKEIQSDKYNVIITTYSVFDRFNYSNELEIEAVNKRINQLKSADEVGWVRYYHIRKEIKKLEKKLTELTCKTPYSGITFDQLGVTRLFVDEAHYYKNIGINCKKNSIQGVSFNASAKASKMLMAVDYLNGKDCGVIMATGTPITNSVTDIYTFQRYLQNGELKLMDVDTFDKWLSSFTEVAEEIEVDVDTSSYKQVNRISKFYNIQELTLMLSNIADFCNPNLEKELPKFNGYCDIVIPKNQQFQAYLDDISDRVEAIRNRTVSKVDDNLLKVTVDGRLAALDLRLVSDKKLIVQDTKVERCALAVKQIYDNYPGTTQIIFCDNSVPKDSFNIYDELKHLLVDFGINADDIEFIHNATTEAKRKKMLEAVKNGKIRIIVGSTAKLGTGVNVQDKLKAIHHLDVPWRPSDMMQREGRIIREGNMNDEVFIYRYIQQDSFDAYSWQILERKAKVIRDILANSLTDKETEDIENAVLSYAEIKAIAVGNDKIKEHIELCNKRSRVFMLAKKQNERYNTLQYEKDKLNSQIEEIVEKQRLCKLDIEEFARIKDTTFKNSSLSFKEAENMLWRIDHNREEIPLFKIGGFEFIVPKFFMSKHRYIMIKGNLTYYLHCYSPKEFTKTRVANLLELLATRIDVFKDNEKQIRKSRDIIDGELKNRIDFEPELNELNTEIQKLEKELKIHE